MSGFLAQEVETAARESQYDFSGVSSPTSPDGLYSLRYADFVMPLVKAVQELSQTNTEQSQAIALLQSQNASLITRIENLEALLNHQNE